MSDLKKILIIDNDLVIRYTLKKIFSNYLSSNLKIYTSSDGLQGLGYVYVVRPDLIIIDSTLPKYSGRELTEYIRTNETLKTTPVILLNEGKDKLENIPENFIQVSKVDKEFPSNLVNIVKEVLNTNSNQKQEASNQQRFVNFLAKKILSYSNISDIESQKVLSKNIFVKSAYYLKYLFDQFLTSVYLTIFYVFVGKKDYEETVDQKQKDVERFRVKTFPAIAFGLALVFFGIIQFFLLSGVFVALTYVATAPAYAASYTWDGGGTDGTCGGNAGDGNKWSCAANWSSDLVPSSADTVVFNGTSTKDSTIDASFGGTLATISMQSGYTGTITLARSLTLSVSLSQAAGTFNGANQTITNAGAFNLTGGTFTSTSGVMTVTGAMTISGSPTFNANSGTINFDGTTTVILACNNVTFNSVNFTYTSPGIKTVNSNCNMPLGNNPTIPTTVILNGTLTGTGTITQTSGALTLNTGAVLTGFTGFTGTTNALTIAGANFDASTYTTFTTANTLVVSSGSITMPNNADLNAGLNISGGIFNAPSGNMFLAGALTVTGSPTFNASGGTFTVDGSGSVTLSCNNITFNRVVFAHPGGTIKTVASNCNIPLGNNPTIPNTISVNGTVSGTGTITQTAGAILLDGTGTLSGFTGFTGTTNTLTVSGGATFDASAYTTFNTNNTLVLTSGTIILPNGADINSGLNISGGTFTAPSGTMTLAGNLTITGSPTFNANGGTITFDGGNAVLTCNNVTFNLVTFNINVSTTKTIGSSCSLPIGNNPSITNGVALSGTMSGTGTITWVGGGLGLNAGAVLSGFTGFIANSSSLSIAGATANFSSYTTFRIGEGLVLSSGTLTLPNDADMNFNVTISGGTFNAPSGNMTIADALTISGSPTFNANGGTITFDSTRTATLSCNNVTFNSVVFAHTAGTKTINSNCSLPLGNNPTISNSIILNGTISGTGTITGTTGTINLNSGSSVSGFSGLNGVGAGLNMAGGTLNASSYTTFVLGGVLTVSSGSLTLPSGTDLNGGATISGGTLNAPSGSMTLAGGVTVSGSPTFNHNNGTITFDGNVGTINCNSSLTFNLVVVAATTTNVKTFTNCNIPLGNNPTPSRIQTSGTTTFSGTGTLALSTLGNSVFQSGGSLSGFTGLTGSSLDITGATLNLSSYTTFALSSTLNMTSGSLTLPNNADLNGALTISGGTFTAPSGNMTLAGALTISGSPTFNHNNGTITLDGSSAAISCNNVTFNRVNISHTAGIKTINSNCTLPLGNDPTVSVTAAGPSVNLSGNLTGSGLLLINSGITFLTGSTLTGFTGIDSKYLFTVNGATLNLSSYSSFTSAVDLTLSSGTLSLPVGADLNSHLIISGGTFTAPNGNMTIAGNITVSGSGVFTHNNGSVILDGQSQRITGSLTFNNVTKIVSIPSKTITFTAGTTTTILGTLILKGTSGGNQMYVRSTIPGTQYTVNAANVQIEYLDVQDFNNTGASVIQAAGKNITNTGNNTRWNFDNPSISSVAPIYLTNGSNIANNKPAYTFNVTDPQASDTVKYQIQIDNNSDFTSPEVDYTSVIATQGARTFTVGQVVGSGTYTVGSENQSLADATYFVRIKGIDSTSGDGGYSTINGTSSAFTVDTTKPTGSVIFGYKTDSTSRDIYLIMSATDNLSGVDKMMISENSNFANATFEEYKTSKAYTVSDGYGQKTIYVKFRDRAGNESISYVVTPNYSQVVVTPSTTPVVTQVPVSYGTPIGGNVTDGLSVLALRVIGSTNAPLANVSINIPSLGINTTTDENGLIVLQNVPLGSYDVLGLFNNKEFNQNLDVSGDQSVITIKLEDAPNNLTVLLIILVLILFLVIISISIYTVRVRAKNKR